MVEYVSIKSLSKQQFIDITSSVQNIIDRLGIKEGICVLYVPHTTAGITINEDADPDVIGDIGRYLDRLVPESEEFRHIEGNSPAHIKSSIVGHSVTIPVENGKLLLGRWQGIFFCEFDGPRSRQVIVKIIKEV
ncbi:MAG: secondary thiamine-phosphate synthase enzyme YjbQ [bacterium]